MLSLANLTIEKVRIIAITMNVNGYQNMSREKLEIILTKRSSSMLPSSSILLDYKPKNNIVFAGNYVKYNIKTSITE